MSKHPIYDITFRVVGDGNLKTVMEVCQGTAQLLLVQPYNPVAVTGRHFNKAPSREDAVRGGLTAITRARLKNGVRAIDVLMTFAKAQGSFFRIQAAEAFAQAGLNPTSAAPRISEAVTLGWLSQDPTNNKLTITDKGKGEVYDRQN